MPVLTNEPYGFAITARQAAAPMLEPEREWQPVRLKRGKKT